MFGIRVASRAPTLIGIAAGVGVGLLMGSLRSGDLATAATRGTAVPASVSGVPAAQVMRGVTLEQAQRMLLVAADYAQQRGFRMSFVVLDNGGHLVATARMDGANYLTSEYARGKAYGVAATGRSSASLNESYQNNPALWGNAATLGQGAPMLPARGALPIFNDGVLLGAIGASGGPSEEDENAVRAAIVAIGLQER
jgi:uncharacterized protein GlcG (DUF336 family)